MGIGYTAGGDRTHVFQKLLVAQLYFQSLSATSCGESMCAVSGHSKSRADVLFGQQ